MKESKIVDGDVLYSDYLSGKNSDVAKKYGVSVHTLGITISRMGKKLKGKGNRMSKMKLIIK